MKCKKCKREIENLKICPYCKAKNMKDTVVDTTAKAIEEVDKGVKNILFLNDPSKITNGIIVSLLLYMLISIIYNYISDLGLLDLFGKHFFYILLTLYFILLKTKFGKESFSYMNVILAILLGIKALGSFFNLLTTFNFETLLSLFVYGFFFLYFINAFFYKYLEKINKIKNINNKISFYLLCSILFILYLLLLIKYIKVYSVVKIIGMIIECIILVFFARYIYLYKNFREMKSCLKK